MVLIWNWSWETMNWVISLRECSECDSGSGPSGRASEWSLSYPGVYKCIWGRSYRWGLEVSFIPAQNADSLLSTCSLKASLKSLLWFLVALIVKNKILSLGLQRQKPSEGGLSCWPCSHVFLGDPPQAAAFPTPLSLSFPRGCGLCLNRAFFPLPTMNPCSLLSFYLKGHFSGKAWFLWSGPPILPASPSTLPSPLMDSLSFTFLPSTFTILLVNYAQMIADCWI